LILSSVVDRTRQTAHLAMDLFQDGF